MAASTSRIAPADIERAEAVNIADVATTRGLPLKKVGGELIGGCPRCGAGVDRFAIHTSKQLFNCRGCGTGGRGPISFLMWLDDLKFRDAVEVLSGSRILAAGRLQVSSRPVNLGPATPVPTAAADHDRRQHEKARWLWSKRLPITNTVAEKYLREARGITCSRLPGTLGYLPPLKPGHHPAMIAAFGLCDEIEPGVIAPPSRVSAVHLTLLRSDGRKADVGKPKVMVGAVSGVPIVIAPANDLLGLAITEGIEDALSVHQALGLGAWAAGSAPHLGKLGDAVPGWIDCCTIFADADADHQGERNATRLANRLRERGIEAIIEGLDA